MTCSHLACWGNHQTQIVRERKRERPLKQNQTAEVWRWLAWAVSSPGCRLFLSSGQHKHWALWTSQRATISRSPVLWRPNNTFWIIAAGRASERLRGRMYVWPEHLGLKIAHRDKSCTSQVSRVSGYVSYLHHGTPITSIYTDLLLLRYQWAFYCVIVEIVKRAWLSQLIN